MEHITDAASAVAYTTNVQSALNVIAALHITSHLWMPESIVSDRAEYDYIVVGAGTAGSIVASRLAQNKTAKILLIESGDDPTIESILPGLVISTKKSHIDYNFTTTDDGHTQQCHEDHNYMLQAGKLLGGTSSVNLMIYERGSERDYDHWVEAAKDQSWSYSNILKYFKKTENLEDITLHNTTFQAFHGVNGPLTVTKENRSEVNGYLEAFKELGNKIVLDLNSNIWLGYTKTPYTIGNLRQSTAMAFLGASNDNSYLNILKNTEVIKILFDGKNNAIGVKAITKNSKIITLKAKKEIIISAGSINTPKLLMLSGIGPKKELENKKIQVKSDLPVGRNYQDHIAAILIHKLGKPYGPSPKTDIRKFPFPSITGYVALNKSNQYPDYIASAYFISNEVAAEQALQDNVFYDRFSYWLGNEIYKKVKGRKVLFSFLKNTISKSRGSVLLRSSDYKDKPIIEAGFYSNDIDLENHVQYLQDYIKVEKTKVFKEIKAEFVDPMRTKCGKFAYRSKEYWKCYILCMNTPSGHACGTCAMGSVVDGRLRVFGVKRLRVADASVIPVITSGATCAPTMMVGEKAADMILEDMNVA